MKKLCFTTIVHGKIYQRYAPMFVYSCLKAYPFSTVKLFFTGDIDTNFHKAFDCLGDVGNFIIEQNRFHSFPKENQPLKSIRWVLPSHYFAEYENVYIGDIDILICREVPSLLEQHLEHCQKQCLPYSNMVRPNSTRLSGLHFIKKDEYYIYMKDVIKKYKRLLKTGKLKDKNEMVLYRMIQESSLGFPTDQFRPHHGLHLGLWRSGPRILNEKKWKGVGGKKSYKIYWEWFKQIEDDPVFQMIEKICPIKEIEWMKQSMKSEFE